MAHSSLRQVVFQCFPQVCTASSCAAGPAKLPLPRRLQRRSLSVGRPRPGSPVEPKSSREFVSNATLGGKVHEVLVKWFKYPRERRATYCGLYFGRGLNNYSIFPQIPSGQRCRACFRTRPQTAGSSSSSSSESSSPCA